MVQFVVVVVYFVVFAVNAASEDHFSEGLDEYQPRKCMSRELGTTNKTVFMFRNIVMLLESKTPHLLIKYNEEKRLRSDKEDWARKVQ